MTWLDDVRLKDLDEHEIIQVRCITCGYMWHEKPVLLLFKVLHHNVTLRQVAENLACKRPRCTPARGVALMRLRKHDPTGFVGGMP